VQDYAPDCPACAVLGKKAKEGLSACETCRVKLLEENRDAAQVYMLVKRQVVTAGEAHEIIDLDYQAVKIIMNLYRIKNQRQIFEQVCRTFHHFLSKERGI
jgi:hypothetical protein